MLRLVLLVLVCADAQTLSQTRYAHSSSTTFDSIKTVVSQRVWQNTTSEACDVQGAAVSNVDFLRGTALLTARDFGFTLPPAATVTAIRTFWQVRLAPNDTLVRNRTHEFEVALLEPVTPTVPPSRWTTPLDNSSIYGEPMPWTTQWRNLSYPLPTSDPMWGAGSSASIATGSGVNNPLFGSALRASNSDVGDPTDVLVACAWIKVDYMVGTTGTTGTTRTTGTTGTTSAGGGTAGTTGTTGASGGTTGTIGTTGTTGTTGAGSSSTGAVAASTTGKTPPVSEDDTNLSPAPPEPWAILTAGLGVLLCFSLGAGAFTWYMNKRKRDAIAFARGTHLPQASTYSSDSSEDHVLDMSEDSDHVQLQSVPKVQLDGVTIGTKIGKGAFGTVFLGVWNDSTDVACKRLHRNAPPDANDDFVNEADRLSKLNHPNIVRFYGMTYLGPYTYIVMEYVAQGGLDKYLSGHKNAIGKASLLRMSIDTAAGMAYLAREGIVHGDLAARNLLVEGEFGNTGVKIADFGMALLCDRGDGTEEGQYHRFDAETVRKFPLRWSAPEIGIERRYSSKSDVWSYGVVLWEIFSFGELPYGKRRTNQDIVELLQGGGRLDSPQGCDEDIYNIMLDCWKYNRDRRPSFNSIRKRLAEVREQEPHYNTTDLVSEDAIRYGDTKDNNDSDVEVVIYNT